MEAARYQTDQRLVVDIRSVKQLVVKFLPGESTFRHVILEENDSLPAADFVAKLGTWLLILDEEVRRV